MTAVLTRTWNDVANVIWPDAAWVVGSGPFATVRGCTGRNTVMLHADLDTARAALRLMHPGGVGGPCMQKHVLIALDLPESRAA